MPGYGDNKKGGFMSVDFKLGDRVEIKISSEQGEIVGIAQYIDMPDQFFINYKSADGRATKDWFNKTELKKV